MIILTYLLTGMEAITTITPTVRPIITVVLDTPSIPPRAARRLSLTGSKRQGRRPFFNLRSEGIDYTSPLPFTN